MPSTDSFHPHLCIQSLKGAAAFSDPTKGGAVPAGREAAPCVFFTCCKNEKYHPSSKPNGYKQWFRRLRSSFRPSALKTGISADTLDGCDILVMGAPQSKFTIDEFNALKDFIHRGGSLFILADEGGEESLGTNINYLLEEYGISVNSDATVRIVPSDDYIHPKETLITENVMAFPKPSSRPSNAAKQMGAGSKRLVVRAGIARFGAPNAEATQERSPGD